MDGYANLKAYLERVLGRPVRIASVTRLREPPEAASIKGHGFGVPLRIHLETGGEARSVVLETLSPEPFGHEHMSDRAQMLLLNHDTFNRLPRHVRSLDVGAYDDAGGLVSLGRVTEFFQLTEFVEGRGYFEDLNRLRDDGELADLDVARADALCDCLVDLHARHGTQPSLYVRRIRELVGHGECVMGLADSYPPEDGVVPPRVLEEIEHACVAWRWRLKRRTHRLRQVHGDFHPWNILFRAGTDFIVLDRSRGEWGEPADDVTCLTLNYLFFSLQRSGRLDGNLDVLFRRFWDRYLAATGDREMLEAAPPFLAFRGLVLASPVWYPHLTDRVRRRLVAFVRNVLRADAFDPARANEYCEA